MNKYIGTIKIDYKTGDQILVFPDEFIKDQHLKPGDGFHIVQTTENSLILTPMVHMSRFRREMRKYIRRCEKYNHIVYIYRRDQPVCVLIPYAEPITVQEPEIKAIYYQDNLLLASLSDGRSTIIPLTNSPQLARDTIEKLSRADLSSSKKKIHWAGFNDGISAQSLLGKFLVKSKIDHDVKNH